MSGSNTNLPPEPQILTAPSRGTRRLGGLPTYGLVIGGGALAVAAVLILHGARNNATTTSADENQPVAASAAEVLAGMPAYGEIPAYRPPAVWSPPAVVHTPMPAEATPMVPSPPRSPSLVENDIRAEALRQQWQQYYQQLGQVKEQRRQAMIDAVSGDTSVDLSGQANRRVQTTAVGNSDVSAAREEVVQAQAAAEAGLNGGGGAGGRLPSQRRAPRPGSLYEGPSDPSRDYLAASVTPPISSYEIKSGDPIQIRFTSGVSNAAPGQWTAIVSRPVYDHATGLHVLIPAGTRVVGNYDQQMTVGSERLPGGATRLIYPGEGGGSLDLGSMPIGDQAGYAGMRDEVNHHYGRLLINTVLLGLAGGGAQLTQPRSGYGQGYDASQILSAQLGLQFGQVGSEFARRQLQVGPTHTIRPGWTGTIQVVQDIALPGEWVEGVGFVP